MVMWYSRALNLEPEETLRDLERGEGVL